MTVPYSGKLFSMSLFLVFMNRVFGVLCALPMIGLQGESFKNKAPLWKYVLVSFASVLASTCQYESLKYVSFTVQILGKSFKMVPVMLWGMIISRKSYASTDWLVALAITGGTTFFALTGSIESPTGGANTVYGLILLAIFLACDGATSTMQEKLFKEYSTSQFNQMLYVNLGSGLVSFAALTARGGVSQGIFFGLQHPTFAKDAFGLSITAVSSQWFILSQVREFGALAFAATINCRQIVSILVSYIIYDHTITMLQWHGLTLVFLGLLFRSYHFLKAEDTTGESERLVEKDDVPAKAVQGCVSP